jgi:class 3 adenylate cyclase/nitrite reductase/ring-hydroxylating ferredoxin subunit
MVRFGLLADHLTIAGSTLYPNMAKIVCLPDKREFEVGRGETILEGALRAGIPHAHACGGHAKCSTCRIWILDGLEQCEDRSDVEKTLVTSLGLGPEIRLACQTRLRGDVRLRRLVLDEADLEITSQLAKDRHGRCGESKAIAVLFCDIRDFTAFSQTLSSYDVMFVLNRYFHQMGEIIERNGGYVDNFIGDEVMALFGIDNDPHAPLRAVRAALEMLAAVDRLKPYMDAMYGRHFDAGIGIHYGEAVIGSIGSRKREKLTAIGDTVNLANRIERANKEAGTRLLISENLWERVNGSAIVKDFVRVKLRGTNDRITLYEISGIHDHALAEISGQPEPDKTRMHYAGLDWQRVLSEADLPVGERKIVKRDDFDLLLIRTARAVYALNNACPHLHLPLKDSEVIEPDVIVCRWHESRFDLRTGEVRAWCAALNPDGTPKGFEFVGDVSKNRTPLSPFPARIADSFIWVALG